MVKAIIGVLIASVLVIVFNSQLNPLLDWTLGCYQAIVDALQFIFASNSTAQQITHIIPLFILPVVIMGIVALLYFAIRRRRFPWMMELLWASWLVFAILVVYHV